MMMLTVFGDGMGAQNYCKYVLMAVMAVMPMIFDEGAGALVVLVIIMTAQLPFVFQWKTRKSVFFFFLASRPLALEQLYFPPISLLVR
jgi:hypothetical protein